MELGIQDIRTLIELVDASTIGEISLESGDVRLQIKKQGVGAPVAYTAPVVAAPVSVPAPAPSPAAAPAPTAEAPAAPAGKAGHMVKSPMVGTFYRAPSPDAPAYAEVGAHVEVGQVLCIIEAMKLMNEIEAEVSGTIKSILVKNGEPVEFGQALFEIE